MRTGGRVVFIYGPPAVGKLTVASLLAERTGYRLSHNHAIIDAVAPVFDHGTKPFRELVNRFREEIIETAAREGVIDRWDFTAAVPFEPNLAIDTETHTPEAAVERIIDDYGLNDTAAAT